MMMMHGIASKVIGLARSLAACARRQPVINHSTLLHPPPPLGCTELPTFHRANRVDLSHTTGDRIKVALMASLVTVCDVGLASAAPPSDTRIVFKNVTIEAGIDFTETIGDDEMSNIVEATGVGCGFLDYDGDGWLDLYLVSGCWLEGISNPSLDADERKRLAATTDHLYHNRGNGTFEDMTVQAGIARPAYGMAVVVADYDADGDPDIYVTNHGPNFLYRNNGDGTFTEIAKSVGVDDPQFSVGTVFFDYDRDGRLDLYVGNYLTYEPDPKRQHTADGVRSPLAYAGQQDRLFRGRPDGTFVEVTEKAGIKIQPVGRAMGIGTLDYDADGWTDVFVSNDAMENFLLHNRGDGTFQNEGLMAGVAFGEAGDAAAAMAVEVGDYDGDGQFDILVPDMNLCSLYRNLGHGLFEDVAARVGVSAAVTRYHGWGGVLADFDLDGDLDVYMANGSACRLEPQPDVLFANDGRGRFKHISKTLESSKNGDNSEFVSRGVAAGDYDNDGDVDLLVASLNSRPALLRNDTLRQGRHWFGLTLVGRPPNRDAIGAVIKAHTDTGVMIRQHASAGSYLSQHDPRIHFGLGRQTVIKWVEIIWPDGSRQVLRDLPADQRMTVSQRSPRPGESP